jgi:hypothetical protein
MSNSTANVEDQECTSRTESFLAFDLYILKQIIVSTNKWKIIELNLNSVALIAAYRHVNRLGLNLDQ